MFVCENCGCKHKKWLGRCASCNEWNSIVDDTSLHTGSNSIPSNYRNKTTPEPENEINFVPLSQDNLEQINRFSSGIGELDRVLGGGFVRGSTILIGGDPGIGKSTLLLQVCSISSTNHMKVLYVSGEESINQVSLRAKRLSVHPNNITLVSSGSVTSILQSILGQKTFPDIMIVDSIQTMFISAIDSIPGTVTQIRAIALELINFCKNHNIILLMVGHVTKEGQIAGPKLLEHMVDVVMYFEGDNNKQFRILRSQKNRFGGIQEIGLFSMEAEGLMEITNPSLLFLTKDNESKANLFIAMEGTRPVISEIEALISKSYLPAPRRSTVGIDSNRLSMILAVLTTYGKLTLYDKDIYISMVGGFKTIEPASDLVIAASVINAYYSKKCKEDTVFLGEISLSGSIRNAASIEERMREGIKLGYRKFVVPKNPNKSNYLKESIKTEGLDIVQIGNIKELIEHLS